MTGRGRSTARRRTGAVEFSFFPFGPLFERSRGQIEHLEQLSDAYHIAVGGEDVMVAYLLEVTRRDA